MNTLLSMKSFGWLGLWTPQSHSLEGCFRKQGGWCLSAPAVVDSTQGKAELLLFTLGEAIGFVSMQGVWQLRTPGLWCQSITISKSRSNIHSQWNREMHSLIISSALKPHNSHQAVVIFASFSVKEETDTWRGAEWQIQDSSLNLLIPVSMCLAVAYDFHWMPMDIYGSVFNIPEMPNYGCLLTGELMLQTIHSRNVVRASADILAVVGEGFF